MVDWLVDNLVRELGRVKVDDRQFEFYYCKAKEPLMQSLGRYRRNTGLYFDSLDLEKALG